MKTMIASIGLLVSVISVNAFADALDGGKVLEIEAEKARKIEDLQYQAELIEQKAKLAKAYKKLHESEGYLPGQGKNASGVKSEAGGASDSIEDISELPTLKSINGRTAMFEWKGNVLIGRPGSELPGGFVVLSVNDVEGVRLKHLDNVYGLEIVWAN